MHCPFCEHHDSRVIDSREASEGVRRRRECLRCGLRFSTVERTQMDLLMVSKRDGRREQFTRGKLLSGMQAACAKRPIGNEEIERVAAEIERELERLAKPEIPSSLIGRMVMASLRGMDHVAYVRFASVYRNFQDIESFSVEVESLRQGDMNNSNDDLGQVSLEAQLSLPLGDSTLNPTRKRNKPGK